MKLTRGNLQIEWEDLGEGLDGDYDPENPEDIHLLRFSLYDISKKDFLERREQLDDCSYCTLMPVDTPKDILMKALEYMMDEFIEVINAGYSGKKTGERLSWISPDFSPLKNT